MENPHNPMVNPWNSYGKPMEILRYTYGKLAVNLLKTESKRMENNWDTYSHMPSLFRDLSYT